MRLRVLAAAIAIVASLAACGSSGGKPVAAGKSTGSTPAGAATTGSGGSGSASGGGGAYCDTLKSAAAALGTLQTSAGKPDFAEQVAASTSAMQQIVTIAPAAVKSSWSVLAAGFTSFMSALTKAGITAAQYNDPSTLTPAQMQAIGAATAQFASPQFTQAATTIAADAKTRCGIDLEGGSSGSASGGAAPTASSTG